jgi:hypothetical protein
MSFPITYFNNEWDYWQLYHKVTFDGVNKTILINPGVTNLDVTVDIYSDWKEWVLLHDNSKFLPALRTTGGDPLPGGIFIGRYFFLTNGWKLLPPIELTGDIQLEGNLYSDDGSDVFAQTEGVQLIRQTVSNLSTIMETEVTGSLEITGSFTASLDPSLVVSASLVPGQVVTASLLPGQIVTASLSPGEIVTASLTTEQQTALIEIWRAFGLDPTRPLVVTSGSMDAGPEIAQTITEATGAVTVQRV